MSHFATYQRTSTCPTVGHGGWNARSRRTDVESNAPGRGAACTCGPPCADLAMRTSRHARRWGVTFAAILGISALAGVVAARRPAWLGVVDFVRFRGGDVVRRERNAGWFWGMIVI